MLEMIEDFLKYTGIHADTFGRLVCNNAELVWALRDGCELDAELKDHIIKFIQNYKEIKK